MKYLGSSPSSDMLMQLGSRLLRTLKYLGSSPICYILMHLGSSLLLDNYVFIIHIQRGDITLNFK